MGALFSACLFPKEMIESDISSMMSGIIRNSGQNHHTSPQEYRWGSLQITNDIFLNCVKCFCAVYGFCPRTIITIKFCDFAREGDLNFKVGLSEDVWACGLGQWDLSKPSLLSLPRDIPSWVRNGGILVNVKMTIAAIAFPKVALTGLQEMPPKSFGGGLWWWEELASVLSGYWKSCEW